MSFGRMERGVIAVFGGLRGIVGGGFVRVVERDQEVKF
jgi:hypothetical protein